MKKSLRLSSLREKEVPVSLDVTILMAAALQVKRHKHRKQIFSFSIAAAAACILCAVVFQQTLFSAKAPLPVVLTEPEKRTAFTPSELVAMGDFSLLEQETFALDQSAYAAGISSENLM